MVHTETRRAKFSRKEGRVEGKQGEREKGIHIEALF